MRNVEKYTKWANKKKLRCYELRLLYLDNKGRFVEKPRKFNFNPIFNDKSLLFLNILSNYRIRNQIYI
jgi:hypothetical protein